MPCVHQLTASVSIYVYANDHAPPHFHIVAPDADALVDMRSLQIIRGRVRPKTFAAAVKWATEDASRAALMAEWERLNESDDSDG